MNTAPERETGPVAVESFPALVGRHWPDLVRLAALLLRDSGHAEDVVQDAVIKCLRSQHRLRDADAGLAYLRRAVVNEARSLLRHRTVVRRHPQPAPPDPPGADEGAIAGVERDAVVAALKALPRRQREALVLRYYADASEKQTAEAMGISVGSVRSHTSRGLAALATILEGYR